MARNKRRIQERPGISVGLDECGTGALAGPVYAAAVIIGKTFEKKKLQGRSKRLLESKSIGKKRIQEVAEHIISTCHYGIGTCTNKEIDELGIRVATKIAMKKAIDSIQKKYGDNLDDLIVDGKEKIEGLINQHTAVHGDERFYCIAAASIVAKYKRDLEMTSLSTTHPGYGFENNKGYATTEHLQAIRTLGLSPIHRASFRMNKTNKKRKT